MNPVSSDPASAATPQAPARMRGLLSTATSESTGTAPSRILLLEDDQMFSELVEGQLSREGFEVVAVTNGVDGVRQLLAQDFDAIVCDVGLPTLPGDTFFRAVQRMRPHLCNRFVFMTGGAEQASSKDFMAAEGGMMLQKPFHLDELSEMLAFVELRNLHLAN